MSIDATNWAWTQRGLRTAQKLILLSLADRADERHACWPSLARLSLDTGLDPRRVKAAIREMCTAGLLSRAETPGRETAPRAGRASRHAVPSAPAEEAAAVPGTPTVPGASAVPPIPCKNVP